MVIEPLGSLMTVQAQTYSQVKQEQPSNNIQSQINIIQPEIFEKKLTTVGESDKSKFNNESNKNFKEKNRKINDNKNIPLSDKEKREEIIKEANKILGNARTAFSYHEETNRIKIEIIDKETNEVIKEIPTEETLDSLAKRIEFYKKSGYLFDQKC